MTEKLLGKKDSVDSVLRKIKVLKNYQRVFWNN